MSKTIAIIPARYQSSRFPGKPLALIKNKPMIQWVFEGVCGVKKLDAVYVATDDRRIKDCVGGFGGEAIMTSPKHESGSDRLAECVDILELDNDDVVLNIQGDEPLINSIIVEELLSTMKDNNFMGTLKEVIIHKEDIENPNIVKVITDLNNDAIYFSRSIIPFLRNQSEELKYYRHLGLYAYKAGFLKEFTSWPKSLLEKTEGLEQLRALEHGIKIRVAETKSKTMGVDIPEQIRIVENMMESKGVHNG